METDNKTYYKKYLLYKIKYINLKNMLGGSQSYDAFIQNPKDTPWLNWIKDGIKKYEGRVPKPTGIWSKIQIGDYITFSSSDGQTVKTQITKIKKFHDFGEAFQTLGSKLVPVKNITVEEVKKLYKRYFPNEVITQYGVIAIKLKIINS